MTTNRMHRRRARRARAVRHCLDRYHQQVRIEEELRALLSPLRQSTSPLLLPSSYPSWACGPDMRGAGPAEEMTKWHI